MKTRMISLIQAFSLRDQTASVAGRAFALLKEPEANPGFRFPWESHSCDAGLEAPCRADTRAGLTPGQVSVDMAALPLSGNGRVGQGQRAGLTSRPEQGCAVTSSVLDCSRQVFWNRSDLSSTRKGKEGEQRSRGRESS